MSREDRSYDEKRDFYRMAVDCELTFKTTEGDQQGTGICRNLSAGGVAFDTDHSLADGVGIRIRIDPVSQITNPLEALAQVVRCVGRSDGDGYHVAATILDINS